MPQQTILWCLLQFTFCIHCATSRVLMSEYRYNKINIISNLMTFFKFIYFCEVCSIPRFYFENFVKKYFTLQPKIRLCRIYEYRSLRLV